MLSSLMHQHPSTPQADVRACPLHVCVCVCVCVCARACVSSPTAKEKAQARNCAMLNEKLDAKDKLKPLEEEIKALKKERDDAVKGACL